MSDYCDRKLCPLCHGIGHHFWWCAGNLQSADCSEGGGRKNGEAAGRELAAKKTRRGETPLTPITCTKRRKVMSEHELTRLIIALYASVGSLGIFIIKASKNISTAIREHRESEKQ